MKIKCIRCQKVEELDSLEVEETARIVQEKNLDIGKYLELINIFRSTESCISTKEENRYHIWVYDEDTENEIKKMVDICLSLVDKFNKSQNKRSELKDKKTLLTKELDNCEDELNSLEDEIIGIEIDLKDIKNRFKAYTGIENPEKWM